MHRKRSHELQYSLSLYRSGQKPMLFQSIRNNEMIYIFMDVKATKFRVWIGVFGWFCQRIKHFLEWIEWMWWYHHHYCVCLWLFTCWILQFYHSTHLTHKTKPMLISIWVQYIILLFFVKNDNVQKCCFHIYILFDHLKSDFRLWKLIHKDESHQHEIEWRMSNKYIQNK